jgi:hypothetical protein
MAGDSPTVRLRQAVLVARELEPVADQLRAELGLDEPFRDPGVAEFGLHNAVFGIGDCFLEVISPTVPGTAAGRYLDRHGDGGYMVIFDVQDLEGARTRAEGMGVRVVWRIDLPDISGTHLHPADMGGAIVSIDRSHPYGSWRWGGPEWTGLISAGAPGALTGASIAVADPGAVAARWGKVLGICEQAARGEPVAGRAAALELHGARVGFHDTAHGEQAAEGLVEIALRIPETLRAGRTRVSVGGVQLALSPLG